MAVVSLVTLLLSSLCIVRAQVVLKNCGFARYDPSKYTCYSGNFLCPIIGGQTYFPCGGACYSPASYSCVKGQLAPPVTSNVFTLTVSAPGLSYDQQPVEANGQAFAVGVGLNTPATYCPQAAGGFCGDGTATVFAGNSLDVVVPGGQQTYIAPSGLLSFTQAHSASYPPGSQFGGYGESRGEFIFTGPGGTGWLACPIAGSTSLDIYANIPAVPKRFPNGTAYKCDRVRILADTWTGGFGAWQYV